MTEVQQESIAKHGRNLLAIFPKATERDPVTLCKKLKRLEAQAAAIALRACNGPGYPNEDDEEKLCDAVLDKVDALLGFRKAEVPVFVNLDARGYSLKIDDEWMKASMGRDQFYDTPARRLHKDWGGYGILAPEINKKGE